MASAAIIGLLTAYSAAVLKSRRTGGVHRRAAGRSLRFIYVLLSLEALSLLIGSVLLFLALAGVMYATRNVNWSNLGAEEASA